MAKIKVAFGLTVTWGSYTADFYEGNIIRDEKGQYVSDEYDDETAEDHIEESLGILTIKEFENEKEVQEYRRSLAADCEVHVERIKVLYLDPASSIII